MPDNNIFGMRSCRAARSATTAEAMKRGWLQGRKAGCSPVSASSRHASRACCAAKTTCFSKPGSCSGVRVSLTAFTSAKALALRAASLQAHQSLLKARQCLQTTALHLKSQLHLSKYHVYPSYQRRSKCQVPTSCLRLKLAVLAHRWTSLAQHCSHEPGAGVSFLALTPEVMLAGVACLPRRL